MGELLDSLHLTLFYHFLILLLQLCHRCGTGTRGTLIARHMDALDVGNLLQRLKHNHHHDRGTVRIGNDTTGAVQGILGIALRHYQGHIVVHTEGTGVVDHHGTILRDGLSKFLRCTSTCTGKGDIHILEIVVMLEQLHFNLLSLEGVFLTCATLRAKQHQFVHGEIPLIKNPQKLLSYGSTCTYNCNFHTV